MILMMFFHLINQDVEQLNLEILVESVSLPQKIEIAPGENSLRLEVQRPCTTRQ